MTVALASDVSISVEGGRIELKCPMKFLPQVRSVPGGRWDSLRQVWYWPASTSVAQKLAQAFDRYDAQQAAGFRDLATIDGLRSDFGAMGRPIPITKTKPWKHQEAAYWFGKAVLGGTDSLTLKGGLGLFICMGGGKSKVLIDLLNNSDARTVLIAAPKTVCSVWLKQFQLHSARNVVFALLDDGSVEKRAKEAREALWRAQSQNKMVVIVTNYEGLWRPPFAEFALGQNWDVFVLEEGHKAKDPTSTVSKFCAKLAQKCKARIALTGTPLAHGPLDAYGLYRALDSSILGTSWQRFKLHYADYGGFGGHQIIRYKNLDELSEKMYSIAFRVGVDVLDLPEKQHIDLPVTLGVPAMGLYRQLEQDFFAQVGDGTVTIANALVRSLRLQQICAGHITSDEGKILETDGAKAAVLSDLLDGIDPAEPVVVFARFRPDLWQIQQAAKDAGRSYAEVSGQRNELAAWQAGKANVLGVQIQAGGLGIDLTRARYCVYYSVSWSLGDFEQSLARVHRGGQTRPVAYYHLVAEGTIERKIYQALAAKKNVVEEVLRQRKVG